MTGLAEEKAKYLSVASTLPEDKEKLISRVIGAAIEVHKQLGPGFLESIYERALCYELESLGIPFEKEVEILVPYKEIAIPGQRLDLVIDNFLILELEGHRAYSTHT